jgi:hypothetical protein
MLKLNNNNKTKRKKRPKNVVTARERRIVRGSTIKSDFVEKSTAFNTFNLALFLTPNQTFQQSDNQKQAKTNKSKSHELEIESTNVKHLEGDV